jgi:hypothetical protein
VTEPKRKFDQNYLKSLARGYTEQSVRVLGGYVNGEGIEPEHKLRAIAMLLERGWGRPNQPVEAKHEGEIKITVRQILEGKK